MLKLFVVIFSCISLSNAQDTDLNNKKGSSTRKWGSFGSIYLMSQSIQETLSSGGKLSSFNMSPVSLSLTNSYRLEKDRQFLWTFYGTHYLKTKVKSEEETKSIDYPTEYGFNFYYRQTLENHPLVSLFAGLDFESFSFFDTTAYVNDTTDLHFNRYNLYFASLGASRTFMLKKSILNIKGMFSHTITSSTTALIEDKMTGMKYQLSLSYRSSMDSFLFYNCFLTRYQLNHASKTAITRIGLGLSYFIQ